MSICFLSGLVELLGISQVPILISALMPPPPPIPPPPAIPPPPTSLSDTHLQEGIHLHAGAHLNDGWRMSNTALVFFSPFHMMLTDTTKISLFETLSYLPFSSSSPSTSTHPSPRSFLYIYAGTFNLKKKIVTTNTWKDAAVVSLWTSRCGVWEGNFFFLFKK